MSSEQAPAKRIASPKRRRRWRFAAVAMLLMAGAVAGCPSYFVSRAWLRDQPVTDVLPAGYVDDASRLNRTHVAETWSIPTEPDAAEGQLRALLERAAQHLHVAIGGARHSMGGHTISPEGVVIDMLPFNRLQLDEKRQILHVVGVASLVAGHPLSGCAGDFRSPSCNRTTISASAARSASIVTGGSKTARPSLRRSSLFD